MIEYRGEKFAGYNKPKNATDGTHKKVVLAKEGDRVRIVRFGAKGYSSNYSAEARKNYRSRHAKSANASKLTPGWWAYHHLWSKSSQVYRSGRTSGKGERFK
jgi:hypothetical protein